MPLLPSGAPQVLLIEDDPDLLDLLSMTLTEEGLQVTGAASVAEAQVLLGQDAFALIVTDLFRPPHGHPFSTLEVLRHQTPNTPMMIMTAWSLTPEEVALRGYQSLLSKPFEREAIVALVKQGLAPKSANDAQERAAHERPSSGEEDDGTSWPLSPLLKVQAAYLPAAHLRCWQPTWVNGHELAAWEQKAGLHAFVMARCAEGWVLLLTTQGITATGIPTLRLTFRHPTT